MTNQIERLAASAVPVIALIWLGLLLGVSFLKTPVKFLAPSLSLPVALDVGRYTFMAFSRIEMIAAAVLLGCAVLGARSRRRGHERLLLAIVAWRSWPTRAGPSSRHQADASERNDAA